MPAPPLGSSMHDPSVLASLRAAGGPLTPASPGVRVPYALSAAAASMERTVHQSIDVRGRSRVKAHVREGEGCSSR